MSREQLHLPNSEDRQGGSVRGYAPFCPAIRAMRKGPET